MAINFADTRVSTISPPRVDPISVVVKLTFADFTTGGTASVKAVLPAGCTITKIVYWKKTAFSGNSISAATLSVGISGTATKFVNAFDVHTPAAGAQGFVTASNIMQDAGVETSDISLLFTGTATTGNPTAGEMYVNIEYVR